MVSDIREIGRRSNEPREKWSLSSPAEIKKDFIEKMVLILSLLGMCHPFLLALSTPTTLIYQ
jgi:hypothetical protein